jgi:Helix-turn-helix domain
MDRELYTIEQARALLGGIPRNTLYDLLGSGALASVPIGRRRFISARAIAAFSQVGLARESLHDSRRTSLAAVSSPGVLRGFVGSATDTMRDGCVLSDLQRQ